MFYRTDALHRTNNIKALKGNIDQKTETDIHKLHMFNGLSSITTWVSWHKVVRPPKAREDGVAVASAEPYATDR